MQWLLLPLSDEDVLVTGERVLYCKRRHWAALFPEFAQFMAVLFLHSAFSMRGTTGLGEVLLLGTIVSIILLRPLVRRERWETWQMVAIALVVFWAIQSGTSVGALALLIVLVMAVRFAIRVLRWGVFQRTYLTDRRLMEVDGFLGTRVNSMPLNMVTDIMLRRSPIGEVLGYGTFRVESAGQDQALGSLDFLLEPERFHDMVVASPSWRIAGG